MPDLVNVNDKKNYIQLPYQLNGEKIPMYLLSNGYADEKKQFKRCISKHIGVVIDNLALAVSPKVNSTILYDEITNLSDQNLGYYSRTFILMQK